MVGGWGTYPTGRYATKQSITNHEAVPVNQESVENIEAKTLDRFKLLNVILTVRIILDFTYLTKRFNSGLWS